MTGPGWDFESSFMNDRRVGESSRFWEFDLLLFVRTFSKDPVRVAVVDEVWRSLLRVG